MKRIFLLTSLSLLIWSCATGKSSKESTSSDIVIDMPFADGQQTKFDTIALGKIMEGEVVKSSFTINNISDKPLVIVNIVTGCGCASVNYDTKPIMPAQSRKIDFQFNSQGRLGLQIKAIEMIAADNTVGRVFMSAEVNEQKN